MSSKTFKIGDEYINDKKKISEEFCNFFSSLANKLKSNAFPLTNFTWKFQKPANSSIINFHFEDVTELMVSKFLKKLKRKCATGVDGIPTCFLKDTIYNIVRPLTHIINLSLKTGTFPDKLKVARVSPIFKSGAKDSFDNYRPISILPTLSRIFEKCIYTQLITHLESNKLLSDHQYGFRSHRSTEHAAAFFTDEIRRAKDRGNLTGAVYIDLSKAFDTISHASIPNKLPKYGIVGVTQQWFTSYLFSRMQHVSYSGVISSAQPIYCGVPQGSILGPLLFLLHFNDAIESTSTCKMLIYADDTVLFYSNPNIEVIQKCLEIDFNSLSNWLIDNELIMNTKKGKTEIMVFATNNRLKKLNDNPLVLRHNNTLIHTTNSYKYLGITLTKNLNMIEHLQSTLKKASSRIHLLRKMRNFMDSKTAMSVYQTIISPTLTYGSITLYGSTPSYIKEKISALESRAQYIIGNNTRVQKTESVNKRMLCTFVHVFT